MRRRWSSRSRLRACFGPSRSTSCQCAGSKFSIASSLSPAASIRPFFKRSKLFVAPERVGIAGQAPAALSPVGWLSAGLPPPFRK